MALPTSRQTLINWCRQELGEPVITVNVSPQHCEMAVDNALQYWREYYVSGSERTFLAVRLTQEMIDTNTIPVPPNVTAVMKVLDPNTFGGSISGESLFKWDYQFMQATVWDIMSFGGAQGYFISRQYMADLDNMLSPAPPFRFREYTGVVHIDTNLSALLTVDQFVVIECQAYLDEVQNPRLWSNMYLRQLTTAYIKRYWGEILKKFGGVTLPSGIQLNGQVIFDEAMSEIEQAKSDIRSRSEPLGMITA